MEQLKTCSKCKQELPIIKFGNDKNRRDGLNPWCKSCNNKHAKEYAKSNPDKVKATAKRCAAAYRISNNNLLKANALRYRTLNKEKIRLARKIKYSLNPAANIAKSIAWQKSNPEKVKLIQAKYRNNNREKLCAAQLVYAKANPNKVKRSITLWRLKNYDYQLLTSKKRMQSYITNMGDNYIAQLISRSCSIKHKNIPPALIEAKRTHLQLVRTLKKEKQK